MKKIDLINQRFGRLVVQYEIPERKNKKIWWHCLCDCGNEKDVSGNDLKMNKVRSCGCLQKETNHNRFEDLSNQIFGRLTVLEPLQERTIDGHIIWKCKCQCGSQIEISSASLKSRKTQSCGCIKSQNEMYISQLLNENNISFEKQYKFKNDLGLKRFDFYVNNKYIIEFDGEQHFKSRDSGWSNINQLRRTHISDLIKNQYCFNNNIPLIRIPYCENYTIDDLKLETTRFLLTRENEKEYYNIYG